MCLGQFNPVNVSFPGVTSPYIPACVNVKHTINITHRALIIEGVVRQESGKPAGRDDRFYSAIDNPGQRIQRCYEHVEQRYTREDSLRGQRRVCPGHQAKRTRCEEQRRHCPEENADSV